MKVQSVARPVPDVVVCIGPPGTGKSMYSQNFDPKAYWKPRGEWWCGYDAHETIVLDDYYAWLPYDTMLRLCDRYPLLCGTKGGQVSVRPKTVIFTTNTLPHRWYDQSKTQVTWPAMQRRFTKIIWMKEIGQAIEFENSIVDGVKVDDCYQKFLDAYYAENIAAYQG